ncbi:hypothetical protein Msub_10041 [Marinobacter subterrani]|uniref:Major facilitator superfamily (MFS) profile domain-containing protein n=1 Tax=Marinobacter subterrani TaxID=1658765 RepID=A0A0J7LYA2_9GAMM|nr:hypothetical protein Msub_10041 [Marinobacter subterrani]
MASRACRAPASFYFSSEKRSLMANNANAETRFSVADRMGVVNFQSITISDRISSVSTRDDTPQPRLPAGIWVLGFVSLLMDISSEIIHSLLPECLLSVLGVGALAGSVVWGLHMGMTQGLLATMVANAAPRSLRGTAFGFFNLVSGIALLIASVLAGLLWQYGGPENN